MNQRRSLTKGESAKLRICNEAVKIFAQKGYAGTSIQSIADKVGLSQTAVLYHFKSKQNLFEEVLKLIILKNEEIIGLLSLNENHPIKRLDIHFDGHYQWAVELPYNGPIMLGLYQFASYNPSFKIINHAIRERGLIKIQKIIEDGVDQGIFTPNTTIEEASVIIHDGLLGSLLHIVTSSQEQDLKKQKELSLKTFQTLYKNILAVQIH